MEKIFLSLIVFLVSENALAAKDVFSDVTADQPVCYGREYSDNRMKATPKQTVQKIQAKLSKIPEYNQNVMTLEITLKGEKNIYKNYRSMFHCYKDGTCQVECDGGSANISLSSDGIFHLKNNDFVIQGGCGSEGDEDGVLLRGVPGGDDKFRLVRLPAAFCQKTNVYFN